MKSQAHKARIVIPDLSKCISMLVKKISIKQANKQNTNHQNLTSSSIHKDAIKDNVNKEKDKQNKKSLNGVLKYKMRVSEYMNQSNDQQSVEVGEKKVLQIKTSYSTDRTCQQSENMISLWEHKQKQKITQVKQSQSGNEIQGIKLSKLSALLSNNKMFINPDKWAEFVTRAANDQQFHKALNAFMYTYFIQHYN